MKTKLYVLVHINADSCRNKKVETKSFMSLEDARAEMKRQWCEELENLNDPDAEDYFAINFSRYRDNTAFIEDMRAGLPYGVNEDIETNEDYWEITEVGSIAMPKIIGYQIICGNGINKWYPRGVRGFDIFNNKAEAEEFINNYKIKNATIETVREGYIRNPSYIYPITLHNGLKVGERVCVLSNGDEYEGVGVITGIEDGTISVEIEAYADEKPLTENQKYGRVCSPFEVFQIVPNKNYGGKIVCYEPYIDENTPYFTPNNYFNIEEKDLEDGEPDFKKL